MEYIPYNSFPKKQRDVIDIKLNDTTISYDNWILKTHTASGTAQPLFIILLNSIQTLPDELSEFVENGQAWFGSSKSGWMSRDLFLVWAINLIHWISIYRTRLDQSIRYKRALLVMDEHGSRECPLALYLLKNSGIDVLILPAHTTHIAQMFDVCLTHPLKSLAAKIMNHLIKEIEDDKEHTKVSILRKCAITALISAWMSACTPTSCHKADKVTGFNSYDPTAIEKSKYVVIRTPQVDYEYLTRRRQRSRLDINSKVINTDEFIQVIIDKLKDHPRFYHLCNIPADGTTWSSIIIK